jgi:hypothetical protein
MSAQDSRKQFERREKYRKSGDRVSSATSFFLGHRKSDFGPVFPFRKTYFAYLNPPTWWDVIQINRWNDRWTVHNTLPVLHYLSKYK